MVLANEPQVDDLHPDEPLWRLSEIDYPDPVRGLRRLQIVWVVRGQEPVPFLKDLGPSDNFVAMPLEIASGIEKRSGSFGVLTVGQGLQQATEIRQHGFSDATLEFFKSIDTFEDEYLRALDETEARLAHKSVFGPEYRLRRY